MSNDRRSARLRHQHVLADISDLDDLDGVYAPLVHDHSAAQVTSGTFADARIAQSNVTQHQAALTLAASQTTSGTFATARLGSGTADTSAFLRGDGSWSNILVTPGTPGPALILRGTTTGNANLAYLSFQDSAGTESGWVGDGSSGNATLFLSAINALQMQASNGSYQLVLGTSGAYTNLAFQASGWVPSYHTALAVQVGISGGAGYVHVYNGTSATYGTLYLTGNPVYVQEGSNLCFAGQSGGGADSARMLLWDESAGAFKRVYRGASDSGGAGFRVLRIAN